MCRSLLVKKEFLSLIAALANGKPVNDIKQFKANEIPSSDCFYLHLNAPGLFVKIIYEATTSVKGMDVMKE